MDIRYVPCGDRFAFLSVNGAKPMRIELPDHGPGTGNTASVTVRVKLKKGCNTIRLSNPSAWVSDLDCMTLTRASMP